MIYHLLILHTVRHILNSHQQLHFPYLIVITKTDDGTPIVEETIEDVVEPLEIGNEDVKKLIVISTYVINILTFYTAINKQ